MHTRTHSTNTSNIIDISYMSGYTPIMSAAWPYFGDLAVYT